MSDFNTDGAFKRFLKGDLDPLDWKGINPNKQAVSYTHLTLPTKA